MIPIILIWGIFSESSKSFGPDFQKLGDKKFSKMPQNIQKMSGTLAQVGILANFLKACFAPNYVMLQNVTP